MLIGWHAFCLAFHFHILSIVGGKRCLSIYQWAKGEVKLMRQELKRCSWVMKFTSVSTREKTKADSCMTDTVIQSSPEWLRNKSLLDMWLSSFFVW